MKNWFDQGGRAYANFRPHYPPEVASYLASLASGTGLAVDVGCGNGQLTRLLADHFATVVGFDPSAEQLAHAYLDERISYRCAPAEQLPLPDRSAKLITAAQAAHWFDLPAFYGEVRRVVVPRGVLALISYGVLTLEPELDERFQRFYRDEIGPFWPPERKLVDSGYATIDFPFAGITPPSMEIRLRWSLSEFLGYISTWSAFRSAREAGRDDIFQNCAEDLAAAWGDPGIRRVIAWPIAMRIGRL